MKKLALFLVLALLLVGATAVWATDVPPPTDVEPSIEKFPPTSDAAYICKIGEDYDFGYMIDYWNTLAEFWPKVPEDLVFEFEHAKQEITIFNFGTSSDNGKYAGGYYFGWEVTPNPLGAVLVKGGNSFNKFVYDGAFADASLYAPANLKTGKLYAITHVVFCWDELGMCYQEQTAWVEGTPYPGGNWATYVTYYNGLVADIYAGQNNLIGTATFTEENGEVEIYIQLIDGWIFYYDLADPQADNNVKVQDYAEPPTKNPVPGKFDWKEYAEVGTSEYTITVPLNNYYGVHLDVVLGVPCE
jgi:hypothetical protein